jgi:hypothetical protein
MLALKKSQLLSSEQKTRIDKCNYESIYLLESIINNNDITLKLSGSTLNIYTISIYNSIISCDCPDFKKCKLKNIYCKHICFVICFIGKIYNYETFNRNILNKEELETIHSRLLDNCSNDPDIIWEYIINKYNTIKNTENKFIIKELPIIESECSICFDNINNNDKLVKCPECKNVFHCECMQKWLKINKTCVLCRNDIWKQFKNNEYLNISD